MTVPPQEASPGPFGWRSALQMALAAGLMLWRILSLPPQNLWLDPAFIVSLYWGFTVVASDTRAWRPVSLAVVLLLFGSYARHQFPWVKGVLSQVI